MMILNPDIKVRNEILDKLKKNNMYCPCMIVKNEDTRCRCKQCREEEICICGLYVKKEDE